jgi:Tfp pilus assembly protein PilX
MQLASIVTVVVLAVTVVLGIIGYVIDRSAQRHERTGDREQ